MKTAARRAQIRSISKALVNLSAVLIATCGFFLVVLRPFEWLLVVGLGVGAFMYLVAELMIPFYAEPD